MKSNLGKFDTRTTQNYSSGISFSQTSEPSRPSTQKKNAFDTLFEIANETAKAKLGASAPKFTLPTTGSGIVKKASSIVSQPAKNVGSELAFARRARAGGDTVNALQEQQNAYLEQQRTTRQKNALDDFGWGLGYGSERIAQGVLSAGEGITDFVGAGFWNLVGGISSLGGNFENPVSNYANEAAQAFLNNSISQDYAQSIEERYRPSDFHRTVGDIEGAVAGMLPSIGAAIATGGGSTLAQGGSAASKIFTGQNLGKTIMGVQAAGNSAQEAYQEGADVNQALAYGTASGLLETVIESVSGGIPGLGKGAVSQVVGKVVFNPAVQKVLDIAGEGGEEALSTIITPYIKRAIYDPDAATATPEEIAQSALMGMAAAGVLQAGIELPVAFQMRSNTNSQSLGNLNAQNTLRQLANQMAAERVQQAEATASRPTATIGQNSQAVPSTASPATRMQSIMGTLGENGKAAFSNVAQQTGSVEEAYPEFSRAYSDGYTGKTEAPNQTPEAQVAYYAGQNDAQVERAVDTAPTGIYDENTNGTGGLLNEREGSYSGRNGPLSSEFQGLEAVREELPGRIDARRTGTVGEITSKRSGRVYRFEPVSQEAYSPREASIVLQAKKDGVSVQFSADNQLSVSDGKEGAETRPFSGVYLGNGQIVLARDGRSYYHEVFHYMEDVSPDAASAFSEVAQAQTNMGDPDVMRFLTEKNITEDNIQSEIGAIAFNSLREGTFDEDFDGFFSNPDAVKSAYKRLSLETAAQNDAQVEQAAKPGFSESAYSAGTTQAERSFYDALEKATGTSIEITAPTGPDGFNGYYSNGKIQIAADAENPGMVVAAHETTHRLQETAPKAYQKFKDYAVQAVSGQDGADTLISAYQRRYAEAGIELDREGAMDEIAADYAQSLMIDEAMIRRMVADDRTLAQKFVDAIKDLIGRVKSVFTGSEQKAQVRQLEQARDLWLNALKEGQSTQAASVQAEEEMRGQPSLKGTSALQRQVQNLQERNQYLKEQMKVSKGVKTDRKKTAVYAKDMLAAYESKYSADALTSDLLGIYDEIANSRDGVDMDSLRARAQEVAGRILEQSVREDAELYNEYASLREYLRNTKIQVPKSIHADLENIGGYNGFRKGNMGRMKLSSSDGLPIDTVYSELAQEYPGLFDEQAYTNPADQLINISDVLESIQPVLENPYSSEMEMATKFVADEILEGYFDVPQQKPTFADRQQAKLEAAKAAGNRRLYEQREQSRERIAQLRQQGREQVKQAIAKERLKRETQVQAIKEKYTSKDAAARERRTARDLRNKIQRHVKSISTKLLSPTDSKNIPDSLRKPVAALLEAVNLESNYTLDPNTLHEIIRKDGKSGGLTGKRLSAGDSQGVATKRTAAFIELKKAYQDILSDESANMVIDPALLGNQAEGFQGYFDQVISMHDKRLADMTLSELKTVWRTVKVVEHSIRTAGKTLSENKSSSIAEWAYALQRDTSTRKSKRTLTESGVLKSLENPYTFFSHYGDAGMSIYKMLRSAQDQEKIMSRRVGEEVQKIIDPKTTKQLEETTHSFKTERGADLTLTTAQVMELYELMKQKDAREHLLQGGIVQPKVESKKIRRGTEAVLLTADDLSNIVKVLTDKEISIADKHQALMSGLLADYGNEASMKVYDYKKFTGKDYWPIQTAREATRSNTESGENNVKSIKNIGLAKERKPGANNALDLPGLFSTFSSHSGDMIKYSAWLAPMEDVNRLFNYGYRNGNGVKTGKTVKGLLDEIGGSGSQKYWKNLMDNIQNGITAPIDDPLTQVATNTIGGFKSASVGGNVRVVVQQPTAYLRAGFVLSPADLSRGVLKGVTKGSGWKKALKYSPIAMRKADGGFDISSPASMYETLYNQKSAVKKLNDKFSFFAGIADAATWGKLWNACEWATAREHKNIAVGSDSFYQKVNELFSDVIDQTQVVDGVLQRANIMRSRNAIAQQATTFMGEPIMSLNMVMRAYDNFRYETNPQKRGKAIKKLGRAVTALVVTNVVNAIAQSLPDAERDDDKDKKYWERFLSAFTGLTGEEESPWEKAMNVVIGGNIGAALNPVGQIPFVRDIYSLSQGYNVSRTDMEVFSDLVGAARLAIESAGGTGTRTRAYAIKEILSAGSKIFGIPIGNLFREASAAISTVAIGTDNIPLMYEIEKASYNITNSGNKGRYYDILFRALSLDDFDSYKAIQSDLMNNMGVDGEDIESAMRQRLKKKGEKDPSFQLSQEAYDLIGIYERYAPKENSSSAFGADDLDAASYQSYADQSADDFRTWSNKIKGSKSFNSLPSEEKDDAIKYARDLAESLALRDNSGGRFTNEDLSQWERWATMGKSYGVDETEAILFKIAYEMAEGEKDEKGRTISGSKKEDAIEHAEKIMPWLTDRELSYLMANYFTPDDKVE